MEDQPLDFDAASNICLSRNGRLLTFNNVSDIRLVLYYLEGLQIESQRIWVGFRLRDDNGRRILTTVERTDVPDDILDGSVRENFTSGGAGEMCVGMREGRFFADACSSSHHFLCAHTYSGNSGREWSWDIHETVVRSPLQSPRPNSLPLGAPSPLVLVPASPWKSCPILVSL